MSWFVVALALAALAFVGWRQLSTESLTTAGGASLGSLPRGVSPSDLNVVIITLDTTRFDAMGYAGAPGNYAQLKEAGVAMIGWGAFITELVNFVILAWIIFLIVKAANRAMPPAEAPAGPSEVDLLAEIRDELKRRP